MQLSKHVVAAPYIAVMAKTAAMFGPGDGRRALEFGKTLVEVGAVAVPLATLAASGIAAAAQKLTEASRKAEAYKMMMQENPHLHDRDAVTVQRYFNTLHRLNPGQRPSPIRKAATVPRVQAVQQRCPTLHKHGVPSLHRIAIEDWADTREREFGL
jgi:hypothetical protein